jgi:hypothetical protein
MADFTQDDLINLMSRWLEPERIPKRFRIVTDTTDFYRVDYDDVAIFEGRPYLIRNVEKEGRFGIDEQRIFNKEIPYGAAVFYESTDKLFSDMEKAMNKIC